MCVFPLVVNARGHFVLCISTFPPHNFPLISSHLISSHLSIYLSLSLSPSFLTPSPFLLPSLNILAPTPLSTTSNNLSNASFLLPPTSGPISSVCAPPFAKLYTAQTYVVVADGGLGWRPRRTVGCLEGGERRCHDDAGGLVRVFEGGGKDCKYFL